MDPPLPRPGLDPVDEAASGEDVSATDLEQEVSPHRSSGQAAADAVQRAERSHGHRPVAINVLPVLPARAAGGVWATSGASETDVISQNLVRWVRHFHSRDPVETLEVYDVVDQWAVDTQVAASDFYLTWAHRTIQDLGRSTPPVATELTKLLEQAMVAALANFLERVRPLAHDLRIQRHNSQSPSAKLAWDWSQVLEDCLILVHQLAGLYLVPTIPVAIQRMSRLAGFPAAAHLGPVSPVFLKLMGPLVWRCHRCRSSHHSPWPLTLWSAAGSHLSTRSTP